MPINPEMDNEGKPPRPENFLADFGYEGKYGGYPRWECFCGRMNPGEATNCRDCHEKRGDVREKYLEKIETVNFGINRKKEEKNYEKTTFFHFRRNFGNFCRFSRCKA